MKTRSGFVSNSSTSSFVLIGICLDNVKDIKALAKAVFDDLEEDISEDGAREALTDCYGGPYECHYNEGEGTHYWGKALADFEYDVVEISFPKLELFISDLTNILEKAGIKGGPSIFAGTVMS